MTPAVLQMAYGPPGSAVATGGCRAWLTFFFRWIFFTESRLVVPQRLMSWAADERSGEAWVGLNGTERPVMARCYCDDRYLSDPTPRSRSRSRSRRAPWRQVTRFVPRASPLETHGYTRTDLRLRWRGESRRRRRESRRPGQFGHDWRCSRGENISGIPFCTNKHFQTHIPISLNMIICFLKEENNISIFLVRSE